MAYVRGVTTALPKFKSTKEELLRITSQWLVDSPAELELYSRFSNSCRIESRAFAIPAAEVLQLKGMTQRAEIFSKVGVELGQEVTHAALSESKLKPSDVSNFIFTSVTLPTIPAIDATIINTLEFPQEILRIPIYQHGCAGGVAGLSLANRLTTSGTKSMVLSVELCSLNFQRDDISANSLIGSALFADGAACAVIDGDFGVLRFLGSQSTLIPQTEYLMGYDLRDDGQHLRLHRELPRVLFEAAQQEVPAFLSRLGCNTADVDWWLIHPGGVKILELFEQGFNFPRDRARWSWDVLSRFGNMSSASILFVLEAFLKEHSFRSGDKIVMLGVGPGLAIELILFEAT